MNIKEAEKLSGVSSRNIRFYEQKGLVTPARNEENDYREYSDEDIHRLKLIRALRMVDMPLEQIKQIVDGELSLQTAAAGQKKIIKEKIKKLETAAHFCEDLADPAQDLDEVLMRMDEPENRKVLSKQWNFDHAEWAKKFLMPPVAGLIPLFAGLLLLVPMLLAGYIAQGYLITLALLMLGCWGYLGYRLFEKQAWITRLLLVFVFPVAALVVVLMDGNDLHASLQWICQQYFVHFSSLGGILGIWSDTESTGYILCFAANTICFFLGWLLRMLVSRPREDTRKRSAIAGWFSEHPQWQLMMFYLLVIILIVPPAFVIDLRPNDTYFDPSSLYSKYDHSDNCLAKTKDGVVWFTTSEEFAELARFDEWERKYTWFGFGVKVLTIDKDSIRAGANLTFYGENCVKVHNRGFLGPGTSSYYQVPDGVIEALEEYVKARTYKDGSAWDK